FLWPFIAPAFDAHILEVPFLLSGEAVHPRPDRHLSKELAGSENRSDIFNDVLFGDGSDACVCLVGRTTVKVAEELLTQRHSHGVMQQCAVSPVSQIQF